jgi:hypothetical protein
MLPVTKTRWLPLNFNIIKITTITTTTTIIIITGGIITTTGGVIITGTGIIIIIGNTPSIDGFAKRVRRTARALT